MSVRRVWPVVLSFVVAFVAVATIAGQDRDRFRQLEEILPTPNEQRAASGAPGHRYWQQRADYVIDVELDDEARRIVGSEVVAYQNNSPDALGYLWMQIDNNIFDRNSIGTLSQTAPEFSTGKIPYKEMARMLALEDFDGAVNIQFVKDERGRPLKHTIVGTMMRIELDRPLAPGGQLRFSVGWDYLINDATTIRFRTGYEHFEEDGNTLYEIAHWYPRMVAYTDVNGWHHKQFVGSGEFTLEFGDFLVRITVPADHIVGATGELQNAARVLTQTQQDRFRRAQTAEEPIFIVTPEEAKANEKRRAKKKKTWVFKAANVRDFAFASSRKFIWDAMRVRSGGRNVLAMSLYPNEAEPLWSRYSTQAVAHTIEVYSKFTIDYPYPVAWSINGPVGGMEYPMICFNGPRADKDGTYYPTWMGGDSWWNSKYGLISVVIHEVGHNYFPMIINSDERQWTWMDEGLNTFVQYLAEQEWEEDYPSWRGEPEAVVPYMTSGNQVPIMTNSESILQFGNNAYAKPATALNILRETILGREQFDYAFKEYARRWKFKRPEPADFFRTMEDASGTDLDWFWRGWFYSTDHVDIAVDGVRWYAVDTLDPDVEKPRKKLEKDERPKTLSELRNAPLNKRVDRFGKLKDFYNSYDEHDVTPMDRDEYQKLVNKLVEQGGEKKAALLKAPHNFYVIDFSNKGGVVMPIPLELRYTDGSVEEKTLPAEIWRRDPDHVSWMLMTTKELAQVVVDKRRQIADANERNNHWPRMAKKTRFQLFEEEAPPSPMKKKKMWEEEQQKKKEEEAKKNAAGEGAAPKGDSASPTDEGKKAGGGS